MGLAFLESIGIRNRVGTCCSLTYRVAELHNNHSWANKEVSS